MTDRSQSRAGVLTFAVLGSGFIWVNSFAAAQEGNGAPATTATQASSAPATSVYLASCSGASLAGTNTNACANMTGFITH